jgi:hypothetical protein
MAEPVEYLPEGPRLRLLEAAHLQAIEGNPLTAEDFAMFEMFEREGFSAEQRRAYIISRIERSSSVHAAE